jgi:hypothetical protein
MKMPRLTGPLHPTRKWHTWPSNVLITHPILQIWPVALPPVPWNEKQLKGRHFSSDMEVIVAVETWWDRQPSKFLLSGLQI